MSGPRTGSGLVELLVATAVGVAVFATLGAAVGTGLRALVATGARGEVEDTVQLAVEALTFDARRAGYDPALAGVAALADARPDGLTLTADLDGDGTVDGTSEETISYACPAGAARLSRIVGRQSLPLADGVRVCRFSYLDGSGAALATPPGGLAAAARLRVRALVLDLTLAAPGLTAPTGRRVLVALRRAP